MNASIFDLRKIGIINLSELIRRGDQSLDIPRTFHHDNCQLLTRADGEAMARAGRAKAYDGLWSCRGSLLISYYEGHLKSGMMGSFEQSTV